VRASVSFPVALCRDIGGPEGAVHLARVNRIGKEEVKGTRETSASSASLLGSRLQRRQRGDTVYAWERTTDQGYGWRSLPVPVGVMSLPGAPAWSNSLEFRPVEMPHGTVTLLFTDIVGSTQLWDTAPAAMATALERHDEILRASIGNAGGWVFKTVGDAFCASFETAEAAILAAAEAQRALTAQQWSGETPIVVRMGVHTGACQERDGDYFGPPVNRVSRLEAVAHGGQVVLSHAVAQLVADSLPAGVQLRALGEHRLKDLQRPEEVFQLVIEGLPDEFPPLRSLSDPLLKHNLPPQLTSFVGRTTQLAEVATLLGSARLVTLVGAGGCGKTRLALQVAADLLDADGDGVWFVDLAPLRNHEAVAPAVAAVLGIGEEPERDITETLAAGIGDRSMLVLLDNCEHLVDACAKLADALLRACPGLVLLATSREPLSIDGEHTYRVPSLEAPAAHLELDELLAFESVQLLVQRARSYDSTFEVTAATAGSVGAICHRLDGIPLAIELVASRLSMMTPAEIERRLDDRFRLLAGPNRSVVHRQQTLQASIDWSYELLTGPQQAVLRRASVFVGTFDLAAAEAVCAADDVDPHDVVELVHSLVDRSLLRPVFTNGDTRFGMGESVREYAAGKLEVLDDRAAARDRHVTCYVRLATRIEMPPDSMIRPESIADERARLEIGYEDADNLLEALRRALEVGEDPDAMLRLAYCWSERCWKDHQYAEGVEHLRRALECAASGAPALRARVLLELGNFLVAQGRTSDGAASYDQAKASALTADRIDVALVVLARLSYVGHKLGDGSVHAATEEGVALAEATGDEDLVAYARYVRGSKLALEDPEASLADLRGAAAHFRSRRMEKCYWECLADLAMAELEVGDLEHAKGHFEEVLASDVGVDDAFLESTYLNLAEICLQLGDAHGAVASWRGGSQSVAASAKAAYFVPTILIAALCCTAIGATLEAARLHGAAERLAEDLDERFEPFEAGLRDADLASLNAALGGDTFERERRAGRELTFDESMAIAIAALPD
jgi:predicted ATPase/class 3 adenylate cyclase